MKKASLFLSLFLLAIVFQSFSQATAPKDFFAGKWEINLSGTPAGDIKWVTDLVRIDGKLSGILADGSDATKPKRKINSIEESTDKIVIFFTSSQGDEIPLELTKVDNENLKGTLMDTFEAKARRIKD